jgi:hypothetical protein
MKQKSVQPLEDIFQICIGIQSQTAFGIRLANNFVPGAQRSDELTELN